jgi:hypothetical protein
MTRRADCSHTYREHCHRVLSSKALAVYDAGLEILYHTLPCS